MRPIHPVKIQRFKRIVPDKILEILRCFQWTRSISLVVWERGRLARRVWRPAKHIFIKLTLAPRYFSIPRQWQMFLVGRSCRFALTKTAPPCRPIVCAYSCDLAYRFTH